VREVQSNISTIKLPYTPPFHHTCSLPHSILIPFSAVKYQSYQTPPLPLLKSPLPHFVLILPSRPIARLSNWTIMRLISYTCQQWHDCHLLKCTIMVVLVGLRVSDIQTRLMQCRPSYHNLISFIIHDICRYT